MSPFINEKKRRKKRICVCLPALIWMNYCISLWNALKWTLERYSHWKHLAVNQQLEDAGTSMKTSQFSPFIHRRNDGGLSWRFYRTTSSCEETTSHRSRTHQRTLKKIMVVYKPLDLPENPFALSSVVLWRISGSTRRVTTRFRPQRESRYLSSSPDTSTSSSKRQSSQDLLKRHDGFTFYYAPFLPCYNGSLTLTMSCHPC